MKPPFLKIVNNQDGSLMMITLLMMATLAIAGMLMTDDAYLESQVSRNYAIHKQCVNGAEAAGKEFVQAIDNIFESSATPAEAVGRLDAEVWTPHDDYNTTFDFDEASWATYNLKISNLDGTIPYLDSAEAIAVLVDQTSAAPSYGLGAAAVPEFYTYVIYCRAEHSGAFGKSSDPQVDASEAILMIGYRQPAT